MCKVLKSAVTERTDLRARSPAFGRLPRRVVELRPMASPSPPAEELPTSSSLAPDARAAGTLFTTLYAELHGLASRQLSRLPAHEVINTTALLHEAYLDMAKRHGLSFPSRGQFMAYAAR